MTTIPVKSDTKERYDELRGRQQHDQFIQELIAVYGALTTAQRHIVLAQAAGADLPPAEVARLLDAQAQGA